ncbi:MAG: 4-(cytidine 5'-diphospho)-2-C-methyl-D-erythritol kinase [Acidobacteria bacterium]|nr:4-(cytidine 5'-diphospho)-2-C-methyl-D-erythritol kinase [Acidobacteriota bacterium]
MRLIALRACAKINLGLRILGLRDDGFHELRTIYQSVSLADKVEVGLSGGNGAVRLESSGFEVPRGSENLAVRAAEAVRKALRIRRGILVRLHKRIPPGSGLGGASSDAAAVLRAVPALCGKTLPIERLLHLAAGLGSDVPFFLIGGRAIGLGRGEEVYPLPESPRRSVVIVLPGKGMSTAEAYRLLDIVRRRPRLTAAVARPTIELFCGQALHFAALRVNNDFEPLLFRRRPELAEAKRLLLRRGAEVASLSGSGSAVFGIFEDAAKARRAARELRDSGANVFLGRTISRREFSRSGAVSRFPGVASRIR